MFVDGEFLKGRGTLIKGRVEVVMVKIRRDVIDLPCAIKCKMHGNADEMEHN